MHKKRHKDRRKNNGGSKIIYIKNGSLMRCHHSNRNKKLKILLDILGDKVTTPTQNKNVTFKQ